MAIPSLRDFLWRVIGRGNKPKPAFATEQEAYEFCQRVYKETGGVTPELQRAYEFYQKNFNDDCRPGSGHQTT
jgi:hypothetical protein